MATGSAAKSISRITKNAVVVDAETGRRAAMVRVPLGGRGAAAQGVTAVDPKEVPGAGSYLVLSVVPEHGRVAA